ncbi:rare lipoprotein A [Polaromonas sp. OV174]|nr:rare lipoprotein A [Polaromonas sp. OV174]
MLRRSIKYGFTASLLAVLVGCSTLPSPTVPTSPDASAAPPAPSKSRPAIKTPAKPRPAASDPAAQAQDESANKEQYELSGEAVKLLEQGQASWYGPGFHGRLTASGERYDMYALTAAHKTLPFGTLVRVRSLATGHEIEVRINDRGPFTAGRVIDVSRAAAEELGMLDGGVKEVELLVPESTPQVVKSKRTVVKKRSRAIKRKPARR